MKRNAINTQRKSIFSGIHLAICALMLFTGMASGAIVVTDRGGNDVSASTLIDSDMIHIQTNSTPNVTIYTYQYVMQSDAPTSEAWEALRLRPFYQDLFFYRESENQWIRVTVESEGGSTLTHVCGLKGGVVTVPPDDPILPHDWVNAMGWGGARNRNVLPDYREKAEGTAVTMKRMGFRASRMHLPVEDYRLGNEEVMAEFDRRIDMQLRQGFCVAICGNTYSLFMMEPSYSDEIAATMRAGWNAVAERYKNKSHRLAFAFFVELKNATNMGTLREMHEDLSPRIRAITPNRLLVYQGKSRNAPENFPTFDKYVPGLGSPYYLYSFHKGFGGANNSWYRSEQDRNLRFIQPAVDYVNSGDTAVFMDVYNHENTQAGPEPFAHRVQHVREMWEHLMSGRRPISSICTGFFDSKFDGDILYNPDGSVNVSTSYARAAFEVLNGDVSLDENDWDGDGLSNQDEEQNYKTDPRNCDTDGDNMFDGEEVQHGFNPLDPRDGLSTWEGRHGADADGDGIPNAWELRYHPTLNPFDPADAQLDSDGDGLKNLYEIWQRTRLDSSKEGPGDEDNDGILNLEEWTTKTNPLSGEDVDRDGLIDDADPVIWVSENDNVIRYVFEDGIKDTSLNGSENSGTLVGDARTTNGILVLDGDEDMVLIPKTDLGATSSRSIHLEFNAVSVSDGYQVLYKEGNATDGLAIYLYNDEVWSGVWTIDDDEQKHAYLQVGAATAGQWHKVDVVFDGAIPKAPQLKGYFDGRSAGKPVALSFSSLNIDDGNVTLGGAMQPIRLKRNRLKTDLTETVEGIYFKGEMDFVNVFNCVLSDMDVQHLCGLFTPAHQGPPESRVKDWQRR